MNKTLLAPSLSAPSLLASSLLAAGVLAAGASGAWALAPGNFSLQGVQKICLQPNGRWYGETFGPWGGVYTTGPSGQVALFGNYKGGFGNDSVVIRGGSSQWTEWTDSLSYTKFLVGPFTRTSKTCSPPAVQARPGRDNPTD